MRACLARVCRRRLREHLVERCREGGVKYLAGEVTGLQEGGPEPSARCRLTLSDGTVLKAQCAPLLLPRGLGPAFFPTVQNGLSRVDSAAWVEQG